MAEFVMFHLTTMIKKSQSQRYEIASGINNRQCNCVGYFFFRFLSYLIMQISLWNLTGSSKLPFCNPIHVF